MDEVPTTTSKSGGGLVRSLIFLILGAGIAFACYPLLGLGKKVSPEIKKEIVEKEKEVLVPEHLPEPRDPLPEGYVRYTRAETQKLWNEVDVSAIVDAEQAGLASKLRDERGSYEIAYEIRLKIPTPATTVEELGALNPDLPKALPGLGKMLETAKVSPFYYKLYEEKQKRVQLEVLRLHRILSRHHMFDCETVLELVHPDTGEKALMIQGEMDVVSDGSDGDRMPKFDEEIATSDNYQPFTSYYWRKVTDQPNPMLKKWEERLASAVAASEVEGLNSSKQRSADGLVSLRRGEVSRMKSHSWLIARADPFIVIPLSLHDYGSSYDFGPRIGDYAVVIYGKKIYPAIVGDAGPRWLTGEASLRMAQELNPKATPYNRPESDLEVTYIIFPKSRVWPGTQPNYAEWRERCAEYLGKIGGIGEGYELHEWSDPFAE